MGNSISYRPSSDAGKVILSDGSVQELDEAITVAELMLEHPHHMVVEFDPSLVTDDHQKVKKRLTPLPADKKLEPRKIYLMLPAKKCGAATKASALSSEEARRLILTSTSVLRSSWNFEGFLPWFARVCPAGVQAVVGRAANEGKAVVQAGRVEVVEAEESVEEGRPEYLSKQLSGRGWKPCLDTIKEKKVKRKIYQWLF